MKGYHEPIDVLKDKQELNLFKDSTYRATRSEMLDEIERSLLREAGEDTRVLEGWDRDVIGLGIDAAVHKLIYGEESEIDKLKASYIFRRMSFNGNNELLYLFVRTATVTEGGTTTVDFQPVKDAEISTPWGKYVGCYALIVSERDTRDDFVLVRYIGHVVIDPGYPWEISKLNVFKASRSQMTEEDVMDVVGCLYKHAKCFLKAGSEIFSPGEEIPIHKYIETQLEKLMGRELLKKLEREVKNSLGKKMPRIFKNHYNDKFPREVW